MARPFRLRALALGRFRPSVHVYPPLVLLSCLVASTAAPAVGSHPHESLGAVAELRELLVPGFGESPELLFGAGGSGLTHHVSGQDVPPFQYSVPTYKVSLDGFVVPSGFFLARSGTATDGSLFRLTSPFSFRWAGTTSTPQVRLSWQAGTLIDNVFNGAAGGFVRFKIVSGRSLEPGTGGSPSDSLDLLIAAEPARGDLEAGELVLSERASAESETPPGDEPDGKETADIFENDLLPPGGQIPPGGQATPGSQRPPGVQSPPGPQWPPGAQAPLDDIPSDLPNTQGSDLPNIPGDEPDGKETSDVFETALLPPGAQMPQGPPPDDVPSDLPNIQGSDLPNTPGDEPDVKETSEVFETALLPPGAQMPQGPPLDDVPSDLPNTQGSDLPSTVGEVADPASVPGPLPLAGVAVAWRCSRRLRQRLRQGR